MQKLKLSDTISQHHNEYLQKLLDDGFDVEYCLAEDDGGVLGGLKNLDVVCLKNGSSVAAADFHGDSEDGHCNNIRVEEAFQKRGIGTALYVLAEAILNVTLENFWENDPKQTTAAKRLWAQANRPFGKGK